MTDKQAPYGYCPICGLAGESRERRPNGYDTCKTGHKYLSAQSLNAAPTPNTNGKDADCLARACNLAGIDYVDFLKIKAYMPVTPPNTITIPVDEYERLKKDAERLEHVDDLLYQIESWCKAYPLTIFTEPDWGEVNEKLGSTLLTRVSGSNMRHVVTGIQAIIDKARSLK